MHFTWDEAKRERTMRERGIDFVDTVRIFDAPVLEWEDAREDYGECRMVAIGVVDGRAHIVVYTDRATGRHIISARKANERERRAYRASFR